MHSSDHRVFRLTPDLQIVPEVEVGERFLCRTLDASGGQIIEGVSYDEIDTGELFPVNGPISVSGVKAGDAVGIEIHSIAPTESGHCWTRPGLGVRAPADFHVRRLSSTRPVIDWGTGPTFSVPTKLHIGTIGLLPTVEARPRDLGVHGGNLDSTLSTVGSTVWIQAQHDGGGLFVGDVHAAIGSGEVCGTGIEVAAELELSVHVDTTWAPRFPTIAREGRFWLISVGADFDDTLAEGVDECSRLLALRSEMTVPDAYLAVGLLLEIQVCQVVNSQTSLALSLSSGADGALGP